MTRRVNREILDKWINAFPTDGISHLAVESQVSAETIKKMRASGEAPKKFITLKALSDAIGVDLDILFPEEQAS